MPRTKAEQAWGGKDNLDRCIRKGECCMQEVDGIEFVEWRARAQCSKKKDDKQ